MNYFEVSLKDRCQKEFDLLISLSSLRLACGHTAWFQHHVGAFLWEVYECLYYSFDHSESILVAVCFEQRLRNRKGRIMHYTSAKLFCGKGTRYPTARSFHWMYVLIYTIIVLLYFYPIREYYAMISASC